MPFRVDQSPKPVSKVPPMFSPRIDGVFASRAVPPSPLRKGLDGPPVSNSTPGVDYDDVFGGPPRFATSMFAAQAGPVPATALDRSVARTPSFRSPSLPVFELPVFGDDVFSSSNTYEPRPASVVYDDIFREDVHTPDVFSASDIPRSKVSSRSSSRRMSPVHPAACLASQLAQEEILAAANSAAFLKGRSSTGKMPSRNSFSSPLFDEVRNKSFDNLSAVSRKDMVGSSLPPSPPHTGTWGHVKRSNGASTLNTSRIAEDDVFGGFPQRTYSLAFQAAHHCAPTQSSTHRPLSKEVAENKAQRSPLTSQSSESHEGLSRTLSSSSSLDEEQVLQDDFIEIRMDRQSSAVTMEKVEAVAGKVWASVRESKPQPGSTPKRTPAKPPQSPSIPSLQLKHKSWKDWTSDLLADQALTAASAIGTPTTKDLTKGRTFSPLQKGLAEPGLKKHSDRNSTAQLKGKYTLSSPLRSTVEAKPLEETIDLEETELQAMLTNAWKINEKRERKKAAAVARPPPELFNLMDSNLQEPSVKEGKRRPNMSSKAVPMQHGPGDLKDREVDLQWKSWRKYSGKGHKEPKRESSRSGAVNDKMQTSPTSLNIKGIAEERIDIPAKPNALSETEDFFDPEEIVKVVTEEMSANGPKEGSDMWTNAGLNKNVGKGGIRDEEVFETQEPEKAPTDGASSALSSANGSVKDFVKHSELQEIHVVEVAEDVDSLIVLDASLEGFQDIEGESAERRKSRWVRHLRAKERAAKALEEMQERDAEVQRQQEQKQQLAGSADGQIKRWAAGKEGNLRALLSNLQHVLWPESGWQPISLKDIIEGPDVKKAYRKATLFVHPDKLQQKGATLQQKYIAERVFDILQEAWKTFNLQELF